MSQQLALIPTDGSQPFQRPQAGEVVPERVLVDALSYVDPFDESDRQRAQDLIEKEMLKFAPGSSAKDRPDTKISFSSEAMQKTWADMEKSGNYTIPKLDQQRLEARPPPENYRKNPAEWQTALNNAKAQYQHQEIKFENLELAQAFGANAWIKHNDFLESYRKTLEKQLKSLQEQREELNRQRKQEQQSSGVKIARLEAQWHDLLERNLQAEAACLQLEDELHKMALKIGGPEQAAEAADADKMDTN